MSYMFSGCKNIKSLRGLEKWDTGNLTNMRGMFSWYCSVYSYDQFTESAISGFQELNDISALSKWNTENVKDMSYLFFGCKNLSNISALSKWNTGNVTIMRGMFQGYSHSDYGQNTIVPGCENLENISALSSWKTNKVDDMTGMFADCKKLNNILVLSGWDVSHVVYMSDVFSGCENLESIEAISNWKTSNVKYMVGMFSDCKNLKSITPLAKWDTSNLESAYEMFARCTGLTGSIKLNAMPDNTSNAWNTNSLIFLQSMFESAGSENFILDFSNKKFDNKTRHDVPQLLRGVLSFNNKSMFKNFNGVVIANNWSFTTDARSYKRSQNFTTNLLSDENDASGNKTYKCLFLTDNNMLLSGMKGPKYYEKPVTIKYLDKEIILHTPAVLDSRINGEGSKPSSDPFEIVKHYIPSVIKSGIEKNSSLPTDYIAVASSELSSTSKLSELFQTYTIKEAHKVTFKNGDSTVSTLSVEAGKRIADLKGETIVTSDAVLTDVTMPNAPAKDGFTFKEWNTQADGKGTKFTDQTSVDENTTVYAIYTKNTDPAPTPTPQPPAPTPDPTPNPASQPGGDTPDDNPDNGSGD
ncbi:repeat protein, partial [Gardnerella vaginalis JCP8151B]